MSHVELEPAVSQLHVEGTAVASEHGTLADGGEVRGSGSIFIQMFRVFMQNKLAVGACLYIFFVVMLCIVVPQLYPQHYWATAGADYGSSCYLPIGSVTGNPGNAAPNAAHWLGCTGGFDNVGLLAYAGRFSLMIGLLSAFVTMTVGTAYGIVAGYRGGWLDSVLMRFDDVFLSIPVLYLLLLVITIYGQGLWSLIGVIGFTSWFGVARLMRSEAQLLRNREYAQAARSMGATGRRVMWRHVLPNAVSTMVTAGTFALGDAVLTLSALGFLGLGLRPPDYDWGTMIQSASSGFEQGWWWTLWPVAFIFILFVLSTNYIGDALRDSFEVRLQER